MTEPGRALPTGRASAVRFSGRLLCWSLAAGMILAAVDVMLAPETHWWRTLWSLPWCLAAGSAVAWAVLRAREKAAERPPCGEVGEDVQDDWEQAA